MRALRALVRTRSGQMGESWRLVNLTGLPTGYFSGPRPYPVYAFGYWFAAIHVTITGTQWLRIMRSTDGLAWEFVTDLFSAASAPSTICAAFNDGTVMFGGRAGLSQGWMVLSQDGVGWNTASNLVAAQVNSIAFENDVCLASSAAGLRRSTDFVTWSAVSSTITQINGANGIFVANDNGFLASSIDGATWTAVAAMAGKSISNVSFAGGRFFAQTLDAPRQMWWSTDGANWYPATVPAAYQNDSTPIFNMGYAGGVWYLPWRVASAPTTYGGAISQNGSTFVDVSGNLPAYEVSFNGSTFIAPFGSSPQSAYVSP